MLSEQGFQKKKKSGCVCVLSASCCVVRAKRGCRRTPAIMVRFRNDPWRTYSLAAFVRGRGIYREARQNHEKYLPPPHGARYGVFRLSGRFCFVRAMDVARGYLTRHFGWIHACVTWRCFLALCARPPPPSRVMAHTVVLRFTSSTPSCFACVPGVVESVNFPRCCCCCRFRYVVEPRTLADACHRREGSTVKRC